VRRDIIQLNSLELILQCRLTIVMKMPSHPIDPPLLVTLVAIADTGSFASAAARVARTESAVSMQMKRLEEIVGHPPLFRREGRRMRMTRRGEALLGYARRILALDAEARAMLATTALCGPIRLGSPEDYVGSLLPRALDQFARSHPTVQVDVICEPSGTLLRLIAEGQVDLAVVTHDTKFESQLLRHEPVVWVTSSRHAVHLANPVPLALFQQGCLGRKLVLDACAGANRPYRVAYSSPSLAGLLAVVKEGLAVAAIARCSAPEELRVLDAGDGFPALPSIPIALLRSDEMLAEPSVSALAETIRTALADPLNRSCDMGMVPTASDLAFDACGA
jgi:DNA-binding transcriptional LysR family regulator